MMGVGAKDYHSNATLARELGSLVRAAANGIITIEELYYQTIELSGQGKSCCELHPKLREVFRGLEDLDLYGVPELHRACPHLLTNLADGLDAIAAELQP